MMLRRLFQLIGLTAPLVATVSSQGFGLPNKRKAGGTQFQDLQELAKKQQAGGDDDAASMEDLLAGIGGMDMAAMQKQMDALLADPESRKYLEEIGNQFGAAMEQLGKMSPEEIQKQMKDAADLLTKKDMVDAVIENKEAILKQLESTGAMPAEELAKLKADPEYYESKMRESFDQVKGMFGDPEMLKAMTDAMSGMQELLNSQEQLVSELEKILESGDLTDDTKIEEARLELLKGDFKDNPILKELFASDEMQDLLKDPSKWRENVKEGQKKMLGQGAGVGEL